MTRGQRRLEAIYHRFRERMAFFVMYIQEAHPTDGWQVDGNIQEGVLYRQHQTFAEREGSAQAHSLDLHIPLLVLIEEMDNAVDEAYGAAPERLDLIGTDGRVAYQGRASKLWGSGCRGLLLTLSLRVAGSV